jgi:hypothetical protein
MPLTNEQSRQIIDVGQVHVLLRSSIRKLNSDYRYGPRWRSIAGKEYFYIGEQSKGARRPETEREHDSYATVRQGIKDRIERCQKRLDEMAPVNRALRLGRVPKLPARLLRALDAEGLIGRGLTVIGTHALFAYEAAAGEYFDSGLLATTDLDLCRDASQRLSIIAGDGTRKTVMSIIKRVDRSFDAGRNYGMSAVNDENFIVELISPSKDVIESATGLNGDLDAVPIPEIAVLIEGAPFSAMAIGEDGLPVQIVCPPPDAFVAHKRAISLEQSGRPALKRRRDAAQADAVEAIAPVLNAAKGHFCEPKW